MVPARDYNIIMCLNILYEGLKVYRLSTFIISYTYILYIFIVYYYVRVRVCTSAHYVGTPKSILIEKIINRHKTRIIGIGICTTVIMERH